MVRQESGPHRLDERTPAERAASTISAASAASIANGFSHSTALPARSASRVASRWHGCGGET